MRWSCLALIVTCLMAPRATFAQQTRPTEPKTIWPSVAAGAGLGAAGFGAGALLGGVVGGWSCTRTGEGLCALSGALVGAAVGGTLGLALGVHLGNRRRGSYLLDVLTGVATLGLGVGIIGLSDGDYVVRDAMLISLPLVHLGGTVLVERLWGRRRDRRP